MSNPFIFNVQMSNSPIKCQFFICIYSLTADRTITLLKKTLKSCIVGKFAFIQQKSSCATV